MPYPCVSDSAFAEVAEGGKSESNVTRAGRMTCDPPESPETPELIPAAYERTRFRVNREKQHPWGVAGVWSGCRGVTSRSHDLRMC
jgi:hypothetical protein